MGENISCFLDTQFSGDGSPEGVVKAPQGSKYVNLTGGATYRKTTGAHLSTGWELTLAATSGTITASQVSDPTALAPLIAGGGVGTGVADASANPLFTFANGIFMGASG